jgi:hypothetical protein
VRALKNSIGATDGQIVWIGGDARGAVTLHVLGARTAPKAWVRLSPDQARRLAEALLAEASREEAGASKRSSATVVPELDHGPGSDVAVHASVAAAATATTTPRASERAVHVRTATEPPGPTTGTWPPPPG